MRSLFLLPCLLAAAMMASPAPLTASSLSMMQVSNTAATSEIPLVVIRFNKPKIRYSKQLYTAISQAVKIKPSVSFELVSYIPASSNEQSNMQHREKANAEVAGIMKTLKSMGIPANRIKLSKQPDGEIKFHESHLYVY